ncbi:FAD-binding protein [Vitiosangium sp. GDMCC 1.1324]|uniref:FAD-binding protein n=1 Tax=Vitiosangium sp. (strain GDMCC 1.1324) TaxID=2138576 RepID=UPI000D37CF62|nr:FAD-binding protein [Vitiosangium sp. GDMCC 1.1324]PTL79661.1 phytoene dehydrogenase [Vitiosangium sp. GDMCC 1.1324]
MDEKQPDASPKKGDPNRPKVYVYGGGVAGMTAAHELAIRGFKVCVVERERALGIQGMLDLPSLGGLARTQYFAISRGQKPPLYYHMQGGTQTLPERNWLREKIGFLPGFSVGRSGFEYVLGTARGQGAQSHGYFPELWLEYEQPENAGATRRLTEQSQQMLEESADFVKTLFDKGYFHTEQGPLHDVKIYVQAFADPAQSKGTIVASGLGLPGAMAEDKTAINLAKATEKRLKDLLGEPLADWVKVYTEESGVPLRASSWLGLAPVARNWVRVIVYRPQLPGEHGYRFFPSFYRHVFDTMQRIPLHDFAGQPVGGSVLENLVPLPQIGIFSKSNAPFIMSWDPLRAGDALSRADYGLSNMRNLRITSQDLVQFSLRVLRYMTSCSQRRAAEMEDVSWWDYLEGHDKRTGARLYRYSDAFMKLVQSSSRVLAALDGAHGDARTCGNTYVQLLAEALVPTARNNCTLNGPTSESWFFHWREHLNRLGVDFQLGELEKLELERDEKGERLVARVYRASDQASENNADEAAAGSGMAGERWNLTHGGKEDGEHVYFVVATDVLSAARVSKGLGLGVSEGLQDYVSQMPEQQGSSRLVTREPEQKSGRHKWDRLQTISGIQYFFKRHVNVFDGYLYCVDAEWGLSAICSHLVWQERPEGQLSSYQSILSVDIGDWNTESKRLKKPAWACSPQELQEEVLHQICESLKSRGPDEEPVDFVLPEPDWVHIDEGLEYDSSKEQPRLLRNKTPYLVPIVGDWKNRPGPEPWDPTPNTPPPPPWSSPKNVSQAPHGGYPVHYDRLVFAGTWLRTFTRLTTMESANESARHAVNAILDHCTVHLAKRQLRTPRPRPVGSPFPSDPYEKGLFPTTPYGDYCRIWNPERNELPDFELLQRMDEKNFLQDRPHPWDVLGLEVLPSLLTKVPGSGDALNVMMSLVNVLGQNASPQATHGLLTVLRHFRTMLARTRPPHAR